MGAIAVVSIFVFGIYFSGASKVAATMTTKEISDIVTSQYPGEILKNEKETEFNRTVYEVELANEDKMYELKLDGNTGEILEIKEKSHQKYPEIAKKIETENQGTAEKENMSESLKVQEKEKMQDNGTKNQQKNHKHMDNQKNQPEQSKMNHKHQSVISVDEAKRIALNTFAGEIEDVDLERENGRLIYEIEIERGDKEADIEIDAYTGEVIVIEIDED